MSTISKNFLNSLNLLFIYLYLFRDTYVERQPKESTNDRNDRAIRTAALWYSKHLKGKVDIVLLTDDVDNRRKAVEQGITTYSVCEYVKSLTDSPYLQDKLSSKDYETESSSKPIYPPHLTLVQVLDWPEKNLAEVFYS